jgi:hypothetical protein
MLRIFTRNGPALKRELIVLHAAATSIRLLGTNSEQSQQENYNPTPEYSCAHVHYLLARSLRCRGTHSNARRKWNWNTVLCSENENKESSSLIRPARRYDMSFSIQTIPTSLT